MDNLVLVLIFILFEKIIKIPAANEAANVLNIFKKKKKSFSMLLKLSQKAKAVKSP